MEVFINKNTLLGSAAVLALSGSALAAGHVVAAMSIRSVPQSHIVFPHSGAKILYDQNDNDNGLGVVSQNFESSFDIYDSQGADDFSLKKPAEATEIDVSGYYFNGNGSADSYNVTFYSGKSAPGKVVAHCDNAPYSDTGFGSPNIKCKVALKKAKTYWISIQANMSFSDGGEWAWNTNNTLRGNLSMWRNPGDGFGTGCVTYTPTGICISGEGRDFAFALLGKNE